MQTQVCWIPNPVPFPWSLEEELGGLHLPSYAPAFTSPCLPARHTHPEGQLLSRGLSPGLHSPLAPTAPYHFPSIHTKARLPSPHVLQPQGRVLRLQHSKLGGSKALSTTGKALMILPTAKVLISLPLNSELKQAPNFLKPRKVGLKL